MDNLIKNEVTACEAPRVELLRYDLKIIAENIQKMQKRKEEIEAELNKLEIKKP